MRLLRFVGVGMLAATVHWCVAVTLMRQAGMAPLLANGCAWMTAFSVSFAGHHRLTFRNHAVPWRRASGRFAIVSLSGFAVNELAYAALLHWTGLPSSIALALVLVGVAGGTYMLSRRWAFADRRRIEVS